MLGFLIVVVIVMGSIFLIKRTTDKFYKHNPGATFRDLYFGNKYYFKNVNGKKVKTLTNWDY